MIKLIKENRRLKRSLKLLENKPLVKRLNKSLNGIKKGKLIKREKLGI